MRVCDLMDILKKFQKKSELAGCQLRIIHSDDSQRKQFKIREITFAPNKLVGKPEKFRCIFYIESE
jgi:hypothetical protein